MSEDDGAGSTVTIKYGGGYDAAWFVARGSVDDIGQQLVQVFGLEPAPDATLNDLILAATSAAHGSYAALKGLPATPASTSAADERPKWGSRSGGGDRAAAPTGTPPRSCAHGAMTRREGIKNGKKWVGHFCPLQKNDPDQCKAQFED